MLGIVVALLTLGAAFGSSTAGAAVPTPCPTGQPGFSHTFWDPYDDWSPSQVQQDAAWRSYFNDNVVIIDYAVDQEANAAWYPDTLGYSYFEPTIPNVLAGTSGTVGMGLLVSPNEFSQYSNDWNFLEAELPKFEAVADDLYRQYGSRIRYWYIPTEPDQSNLSTYDLSYQYGAWLNQIDSYLHTHDGDLPVTIAVDMPSAVNAGITPYQFVQEMQPMMSDANMDVWMLEDGFGMTGWTPQEEAAGFSLAEQYATSDNAAVWADVYTPASSTPTQFEPYLQTIANVGTYTFIQWTFPDYMDPSYTTSNGNAADDYNSYYSYCVG